MGMRGATGRGGGGGGGGGGEIIQVQGGHIVRSTGRKDRHSKVYTAKGPRDRRVRLSAHTAIQFYDVQDRLGYDRPSKAVDWLIKKAKSAIDKLAELPPWHPTAKLDANQNEMAIAEQSESSGYSFHQLHNPSNDSTSFMAAAAPPPIDHHDSLPDNMKSFFPTSSTTSSMNFQSNYPSHDQLVSRNSNQSTEDLGLSLHSFQHQDIGHTPSADHHHQTLYQGSGPVGYESNFQRMVSWGGNDDTSAENRGGFVFNPPAILSPHHSLLAQGSSAFSQRGPLQSSFVQSIRAWQDLPMPSSTADHHRPQEIHQSFFFGTRFAPDQGLLAGYSIPARIHGEEEQTVVSDRPSSSSPNSQH